MAGDGTGDRVIGRAAAGCAGLAARSGTRARVLRRSAGRASSTPTAAPCAPADARAAREARLVGRRPPAARVQRRSGCASTTVTVASSCRTIPRTRRRLRRGLRARDARADGDPGARAAERRLRRTQRPDRLHRGTGVFDQLALSPNGRWLLVSLADREPVGVRAREADGASSELARITPAVRPVGAHRRLVLRVSSPGAGGRRAGPGRARLAGRRRSRSRCASSRPRSRSCSSSTSSTGRRPERTRWSSCVTGAQEFEAGGRARRSAISRDSPWTHIAWMQALDLNFPLLSDWNGGGRARVRRRARVPRACEDVAERTAFLIDQDGYGPRRMALRERPRCRTSTSCSRPPGLCSARRARSTSARRCVATWPALEHVGSQFLAAALPATARPRPATTSRPSYRLWLVGHQLEHGRAPWRDPYSFQPEAAPR